MLDQIDLSPKDFYFETGISTKSIAATGFRKTIIIRKY